MGFKYYIAFLKVCRKLKSSLSKQYKYRNSFFRSFLNWFHARVRGLAPTRNVLVSTMISCVLMCVNVATVRTYMNMKVTMKHILATKLQMTQMINE